MKAAASASRRSRAAERAGLGRSRRRFPVRAAGRTAAVGLAQGAVPRRYDPFSLGGGFILQHFCEAGRGGGGEIRARSFNTEKDAAGIMSLCPAGSAASPAVPPPSSHASSRSLSPDLPSSLRAAPSSAPCPTTPDCRALRRGSRGAKRRIRAPTRSEGGAGCPGTGSIQTDRDEAAARLTRLPGAAFARRGLEMMGLQTSHAESSARAKFLEEIIIKKNSMGFAKWIPANSPFLPNLCPGVKSYPFPSQSPPYVRWNRRSSTFRPRKKAGPPSENRTRFKDLPTRPRSPLLLRAGTALPPHHAVRPSGRTLSCPQPCLLTPLTNPSHSGCYGEQNLLSPARASPRREALAAVSAPKCPLN